MTKNVKVVIMKDFSYKYFRDLLEQFLGSQDKSDPKVIKKRQILQAATELFIHHGYRKTSVSDVANRAGVARGLSIFISKTRMKSWMHCSN